MVSMGVDLSYMGVYAIWTNDLGMCFQPMNSLRIV